MNANRIWTFVGVIVAVGVLALGWVLGVSPLLTQASVADSERETVDQLNAVELAELAQMKEQYEGIDELRIDLAQLRVSVPAETDTDFVYALLNGVQAATGTPVQSVTTGQAVPYGAGGDALPTPEQAEEAPNPATDNTGTDDAATTASASVPSLYTVPVTLTFLNSTADKVLAFVSELQNGPRLFLVTSVTGDGAGSATVTAFMFVLYDADAPHGAAAQAYAGILPATEPSPTPEPTESATPTPTPRPTSTTGP